MKRALIVIGLVLLAVYSAKYFWNDPASAGHNVGAAVGKIFTFINAMFGG